MVSKANKSSEMDDWQVESDLRTLMDAEKIEADPKRIAKVRALAKKRLLDMAAVVKGEKAD